MVSIELSSGQLVVHVLGWHKLLALRSALVFPLSHVQGARARPHEAAFDDVIRNPWAGVGTYLRGKVAAGTVDLADGRSFFDVEDQSRAIAIDLVGEPLQHLVVEVDGETPDDAVRRIEASLAY